MCVSTILFGQCCLNSGATKTNVIEELSTIILLEVGSIVLVIIVVVLRILSGSMSVCRISLI